MLKKRDAQGLPIQVIILVVIGLIVLFVVLAIFTQETGRVTNTLGSCASRGGACEEDCKDGRVVPEMDCEKEVCCVRI